jgi:glyoxylase-like metal-dependent hydrolase (beta-lactamase superfamily II)
MKSVFLTHDQRIEVVSTPGHTPGSLSVRLAIDGGEIWMIGDLAFQSRDLEPGSPTAGIHTDIHSVRESHQWLRSMTSAERVFPSHDEGVPERLINLGKAI